MEMRKFEKLGIETSLLGFGTMRLPETKEGKIDEPAAQAMIDRAMAGGIKYYDTAYPYHNYQAEPFVGRAMAKYERSSYHLATKMPPWNAQSLEEAKEIFAEQLRHLQTDYIDFYLLHNLTASFYQRFCDQGITDFLFQMKAEGKIRGLGFSFHDEYEIFERIITDHEWDFCQIQYNYMDEDHQAGTKGYELAAKLGVPMVIMESLRGGALSNLSPDIAAKFRALDPTASDSSYALRWLADHENVKVILSGMSTMEQMEDNLKTFDHYTPLNEKEQQTIRDAVQLMKQRIGNSCTGCGYCMPCPAGVNIPRIFRGWNHYLSFQSFRASDMLWLEMPEENKPKQCVQCGQCEEKCPQHLNIREDLVKAEQELDHPKYF